MLRFAVYQEGGRAGSIDLNGAYLVGCDGVPVRAEIEFRNGEILCRKRAAGPAALAILWPSSAGSNMMLETTRLPERDQPYVLQVELLRGRLMRIAQKREDWGLLDFEGTEPIAEQIDAARDQLIASLTADTPAAAATAAELGLTRGLLAAEQLTAFHAEIFLNRRRQVGGFPAEVFGCAVDPANQQANGRDKYLTGLDYLTVPFTWRNLEPREKELKWDQHDDWVNWAAQNRLPVRGGRLLSFAPELIPDWLYVWEHDFDAVRDLAYEHIRRVVKRYGQHVDSWEVVSGIHGRNAFSFNFEQLMELTRMSASLVKQLAPRSRVIVDLVTPWGEYYAANQRTIPPQLYAEMIMQSGVNFDAFGLQCCFGVPEEGLFVRDLFQISTLLDRFAAYGKPVHLTALQVPSGVESDDLDAWSGRQSSNAAGAWHRPWSDETQRHWLRRVCHLALSKPFIESVTWRDISDHAPHYLPHGGLFTRDGEPKSAWQEWLNLRNEIRTSPARTTDIETDGVDGPPSIDLADTNPSATDAGTPGPGSAS